MKHYRIFLIFSLLLIFTGCKEYGEKRIVKLLTIDKDMVEIYYYNHENEKVDYQKVSKKNKGASNTLIEILSENNYDLKLCKYCIVDNSTLKNSSFKIFQALNEAKFSPDINIVTSGNKTEQQKIEYIDTATANSPIYDFEYNKNSISGFIENLDTKEKNVIINNKLYKTLDTDTSILLDILRNDIKTSKYSFEYKQKKLTAEIDDISTFYYNKDGKTYISIFAKLISYRGISSSKQNRENFKDILEKNMISKTKKILKDNQLKKHFNLDWYNKVKESDDIEVEAYIL